MAKRLIAVSVLVFAVSVLAPATVPLWAISCGPDEVVVHLRKCTGWWWWKKCWDEQACEYRKTPSNPPSHGYGNEGSSPYPSGYGIGYCQEGGDCSSGGGG